MRTTSRPIPSLLFLLATLAATSTCLAAEPNFGELEARYDARVKPIVAAFCVKCHSAKLQEGELDLERFAKFPDVRKGAKVWVKVAEMLDNGEMPPKTSKKPTPEQKAELREWVRSYLDAEALASAGDPGPVVLRRLDNAQYTYTMRDLTGLDIDPAVEFPADGASGEGFTNTGNSLVMSPALLSKYLDAAKGIAAHAVLLPDGFEFAPGTTRRDWSDETLASIRKFYGRYADAEGRLPLLRYVAATLEERDALRSGAKSLHDVAFARGLSEPYLTALWNGLNGRTPSLVLDRVRARWTAADKAGAAGVVAEVDRWRSTLSRFQPVGHMKPWVVDVDPVVRSQEVRFRFSDAGDAKTVAIHLSAAGSANGSVVFREPRLIMPGRPTLPLRELRAFASSMASRRRKVFESAAKALAAVDEAGSTKGKLNRAALAAKHGVDPEILGAWLEYLGVGEGTPIRVDLFTRQNRRISGYEFVNGWGNPETPNISANASDQHVRIPGNMKGRGVAVHPGPSLNVAVGWRSPIRSTIKVEGVVTHAHPECGNGVVWSVELRRGGTRQRLVTGVSAGARPVNFGPVDGLAVQPGDLFSLVIGPRDGNHACDLTDVEFRLTDVVAGRTWNLTKEVSGDVLAGNPHADAFGHPDVWSFYQEPIAGGGSGAEIPSGSTLAKWLSASGEERRRLANAVQTLLNQGPPNDRNHPDAALYRLLSSLGGPLFAKRAESSPAALGNWGLDPALFGKGVDGAKLGNDDLALPGSGSVEIQLPADLVAGAEFVTTAALAPGSAGPAQVRLTTAKAVDMTVPSPDAPLLVASDGRGEEAVRAAFAEFRSLFPAALCYTKIVPVDEVVTLTLFHREDGALRRLMLDESKRTELDRLWERLHFVSQDALTLVDAFAQLMEYATQDSNPALFEPYRKPIQERAAAYRKQVVDARPKQVEALVAFAARAYRRPLAEAEKDELRRLNARLMAEGLPFEEAFRLTLARILISPAALYRSEKAGPGDKPTPVNDFELAGRLSYFLWASPPDRELMNVAAAGRLRDREVLLGQTRRMMRDDRVRRTSREFAAQWLHIYEFDALDEKSERHFPTFKALRKDMYEEPIRFFADLLRADGSVLSLLDSDHTFLNESLAKHYGVPGVAGPEWRRVDGVGKYGRGGVLGFSATLAKQSGASRTSPILRGNWISEALLGERLPRPPKDVPRLPEDEADAGLSVRAMVERHSRDPRCSGCHAKIDPMGFALEAYDAIGRRREKDLGGHAIETKTTTVDGRPVDGFEGLRTYLVNTRRESFLKQFDRKLLGYALGRSVQLSDQPLLDKMRRDLETNGFRVSTLVEAIVLSPQFLEIRGRDAASDDAP